MRGRLYYKQLQLRPIPSAWIAAVSGNDIVPFCTFTV